MIKDFTRENLGDALKVVRECFGEGAVAQVVKSVSNPVLQAGVTAGEIAYQDGDPVSFQIAYPKRVYIGKEQMLGLTAGCLSLRKGHSAGLLLDVVERTVSRRKLCKIYFANTPMKTAGKLNLLFGAKYGPENYCYEAYGIVNSIRAAWYGVKRKVLKRDVQVSKRAVSWFDYAVGWIAEVNAPDLV